MKTLLLLFLYTLSLSLIFYSCKNQTHDPHQHQHSENEQHAKHEHDGEESEHNHAHEDEIIFTKAQAAKTNFEVQEIKPTTFQQVITTSGQILPAPGDEAIVVATSNGIVSRHNNKITEGSAVTKGQILFNIVSRHIAEGDHYSKVKANYEKALSEYQRAATLIKDQIISQREYENIKLDYENAKIAFDAISGNHTPQGVGVSAPLNGFLKNILVKEGEYVTIGQPLGTVSQNQRLVLRAEVSEKYYSSLRNIQSANFKTPYDNQVYVLSDLKGRLLAFGKTSGENSFYIPVSFDFDNKGEVIPGTFVEVFLLTQPIENTLTLPVSALTNEMGTLYVYVQLDEEGYRKQEITIGANNGKEVQVLKGLKAGDRVVTQGAYQVKMASASSSIPHSHEH